MLPVTAASTGTMLAVRWESLGNAGVAGCPKRLRGVQKEALLPVPQERSSVDLMHA